MSDYDVTGAFQAIEKELIDSMIRNFKRHKKWEIDEGFNWTMWQAEQLKSLQKYRNSNKRKFSKYFLEIDTEIDEMLKIAYMQGNMEQEIEILKALKKGYNPKNIPESFKEIMKENKGKSIKEIVSDLLYSKKLNRVDIEGAFFKINDRKLNALIKATKNDFDKAEIAMLRMSNDQYRKIIFNAQVYANTGAGTMEKAVDMATEDFLAKGINCIEYKNGARVNISDYVAMAIQTANKRAYLQGEGAKRQEWGISTVITARRGGGCPKCVPFQGRIFIDDVWSGGKASDGHYPLISDAIDKGFYHPRCKDTHTTYFEGVTTEPTLMNKAQQQKSVDIYNKEQKQKYVERMIRKYKNLEEGSLDKDNKEKYKIKRKEWNELKS